MNLNRNDVKEWMNDTIGIEMICGN